MQACSTPCAGAHSCEPPAICWERQTSVRVCARVQAFLPGVHVVPCRGVVLCCVVVNTLAQPRAATTLLASAWLGLACSLCVRVNKGILLR